MYICEIMFCYNVGGGIIVNCEVSMINIIIVKFDFINNSFLL